MPGFVFIVAGDRRASRCKFCGKPIEWATKASTERRGGGRNIAKNVPLNPNALTVRYERTDGGVKLEVLDAGALHFATCTKKPKRS